MVYGLLMVNPLGFLNPVRAPQTAVTMSSCLGYKTIACSNQCNKTEVCAILSVGYKTIACSNQCNKTGMCHPVCGI